MLRELSKVEQRYDAVLAVIREGMRVSEVAEKFGVHRDTVHSWLARYEAEGLEGLGDRSHRPTALDARVLLRDVQIAARHADPRTTTIHDRRRENFDRHASYVVVAFVAGG